MMSGTIVLGGGVDWSASSGLFSWVIGYLVGTVADRPTRAALQLIDEQNFGWLSLAELPEAGRRQVLSLLGDGLVAFAELELPAGPLRHGAIQKLGELAESARSTVT